MRFWQIHGRHHSDYISNKADRVLLLKYLYSKKRTRCSKQWLSCYYFLIHQPCKSCVCLLFLPPCGFVQSGMTGDGMEESRDSRGGVKRRRKISLWPAVWYDTRYLKWAIWRKEDVAYHNRCWLHKTGQFEGHTHTYTLRVIVLCNQS